ncbi:MAG: glycosyltransferase [Sedimentisphaerales bacterium]|nr:glycosyltransferase [Sedimentisphaerales bacterium]
MEYPKISIVTPSYNQAPYLEATLKSVLTQKYPNLEYIVMDGGSTDGSVEIIKRYADRLAHWESHPDKGQADAIYRGFEISSGNIFGFLNSDDILLPGSLSIVGQYFKDHPIEEWVVGGTIYIDKNGQRLYNRFHLPICNLGARISFKQLLFFGCTFNQPASFWRRDTFFALGGFDKTLQFCFDYDLYLRLSQRRKSGRIKQFLACFRIHPMAKSSTIHNICDIEKEILWQKYGRHSGNLLYQRAFTFMYSKKYYMALRMMQLKFVLGLHKYPLYEDIFQLTRLKHSQRD